MGVHELAKEKQYASIRNILQFNFSEKWAEKGIIHRSLPNESFLLAQACEMVGDYDFSRLLLEMLLELDYYPDIVTSEVEHLNSREKQSKFVDVSCEHSFVREALVRLSKIFNQLKRNITAFVVNDADEYAEVWKNHFYRSFNSKETHPWNGWEAIGVYENPGEHTLFFKKRAIDTSPVELLGLCAHEMAHLELTDIDTRTHLSYTAHRTNENFFFNERFTDLYVVSRGFGYELAAHRKGGRSHAVMSYEQIIQCIEDSNRV